MEMSDEGRMDMIYSFYFDYLPGLRESSSSLRGRLELEVVK